MGKIRIIAAYDENRSIGFDGGIPWKIPEDMKFFKEMTTDSVVVMGRTTFESIKMPLSHRVNIVLSRSNVSRKFIRHHFPGVIVSSNLHDAIYGHTDDVWIIGGEQIYQEALYSGLVDEAYITKVMGIYPGDKFFPLFDSLWQVEKVKDLTDIATVYKYSRRSS